MIDEGKLELLQEMYATWPFFSVTLDMVEMVWPSPSAAHSSSRHLLSLIGLLRLMRSSG